MERRARNEEIEIKLYVTKPESSIWYRRRDDQETGWISSPFSRHHVQTESEALMLIDSWLNRGGTE